MHERPVTPKHAPVWLFGITNLPFGVAGGYLAVAVPFLLRNAGLSVHAIANIVAVALLPAAYQLFWAPVLDLGIRRRAWLVYLSLTGGLCLGATMLIEIPGHLREYEVFLVVGQLLTGLVASCNGALVSTTLPDNLRGRAAGWVNAGNLGASVLGGGLTLTLANHVSTLSAAIALFLCVALPSLAALLIAEPPPCRDKLVPHMGRMRRDVWNAVKARKGWSGLLFCISPVGTAVMVNLFASLKDDYHVSKTVIEFVDGYGAGFVTAAGALISGYFLDRMDRRFAYLLSGGLTAVCAICMALSPLNATTFIVGSLVYLFVTGFCYAAFSAVVYEIVGTAGTTASTLYSVFPAAGNQAIAYVTFLDGLGHKHWGAPGMLASDAALNVAGIVALLVVLRFAFPHRQAAVAEKPVAEPAHVFEEPVPALS